MWNCNSLSLYLSFVSIFLFTFNALRFAAFHFSKLRFFLPCRAYRFAENRDLSPVSVDRRQSIQKPLGGICAETSIEIRHNLQHPSQKITKILMAIKRRVVDLRIYL